jgi:hypothetical protein
MEGEDDDGQNNFCQQTTGGFKPLKFIEIILQTLTCMTTLENGLKSCNNSIIITVMLLENNKILLITSVIH